MPADEPEIPARHAAGALSEFARRDLPFVVIGGAALALHGIPRTTVDIDIMVPLREGILQEILDGASSAGLECRQEHIELLSKKLELLRGQWLTFRDGQGRDLVDVLLESEEDFRRYFEGSVERRLLNARLRIAALSDIEEMKKKIGRPIDKADIALIEEFNRLQEED